MFGTDIHDPKFSLLYMFPDHYKIVLNGHASCYTFSNLEDLTQAIPSSGIYRQYLNLNTDKIQKIVVEFNNYQNYTIHAFYEQDIRTIVLLSPTIIRKVIVRGTEILEDIKLIQRKNGCWFDQLQVCQLV